MKVITYPMDKNCYKQGNIRQWVQANKIEHVVEIHRNASTNNSATGFGLVKNFKQSKTTALDNEIKDLFQKYYGIREDVVSEIYNINQIWDMISYSYLEIGFISNENDNQIFDWHHEKIGNEMYELLKDFGFKTIGVVYGHGGGDPGACNGKRTEMDDVRRIKLTEKKENNIPSDWAKNSWQWAIDGKLIDGTRPHDNLTREELVTILYRMENEKK